MIPLSAPFLNGREWKYVKECLDSGWVSTAGEFVSRFESAVAAYTGAAAAVATSNGTAALHTALLISGLRPDDEVLVPTVTFIASVNAVNYCRAHPVFFDCDESYNIDVQGVEIFLEQNCERTAEGLLNKSTRRRVWGILPVHVFGFAAEIERLCALAARFGICVVEDAAESLGTFTSGRHTGNFGMLGCLSFNGNKIVTSGGGGMILTSDLELARRAKYLTTQAKDDTEQFIHHEVGYNYRLTNIEAALGLAQLEQLPDFIDRKAGHFQHYREFLSGIEGVRLIEPGSHTKWNHWLFALRLDPERFPHLNAVRLMERLKKYQIETRPLWYLNHLQRPFAKCQAFQIVRAPKLLAETLNIPCSSGLTPDEIETVCAALKAALTAAS